MSPEDSAYASSPEANQEHREPSVRLPRHMLLHAKDKEDFTNVVFSDGLRCNFTSSDPSSLHRHKKRKHDADVQAGISSCWIDLNLRREIRAKCRGKESSIGSGFISAHAHQAVTKDGVRREGDVGGNARQWSGRAEKRAVRLSEAIPPRASARAGPRWMTCSRNNSRPGGRSALQERGEEAHRLDSTRLGTPSNWESAPTLFSVDSREGAYRTGGKTGGRGRSSLLHHPRRRRQLCLDLAQELDELEAACGELEAHGGVRGEREVEHAQAVFARTIRVCVSFERAEGDDALRGSSSSVIGVGGPSLRGGDGVHVVRVG
ncbi:hypothetical protein B0H14DRAFT_2598250 [Mycena olivaceomarginata]|nr:hypothetical protein B0H14DRAFT_2598250 [Mycena olivaceomarginata]